MPRVPDSGATIVGASSQLSRNTFARSLNFSGFEDEELCGLGKALVRELRSTRVAWFKSVGR